MDAGFRGTCLLLSSSPSPPSASKGGCGVLMVRFGVACSIRQRNTKNSIDSASMLWYNGSTKEHRTINRRGMVNPWNLLEAAYISRCFGFVVQFYQRTLRSPPLDGRDRHFLFYPVYF